MCVCEGGEGREPYLDLEELPHLQEDGLGMFVLLFVLDASLAERQEERCEKASRDSRRGCSRQAATVELPVWGPRGGGSRGESHNGRYKP